MNNQIGLVLTKIEEALKSRKFEPCARKPWQYRRKSSSKTPYITTQIITMDAHEVGNNGLLARTVYVTFAEDIIGAPFCRSKGYVLIRFVYNDDEIIDVKGICDCPNDAEFISNTIMDIREKLIKTGWFGRTDI